MLLYSIKFDFLELLKRTINENEKKLYFSTVKALTTDKELSFADNTNNTTIPISTFQFQSDSYSYILKDKFNEWIITAGLINEEGKLVKNSFYISIDITKNVSDKLCIQLFYYLSKILKLLQHDNNIIFFIFMDILPSDNDVLLDSIKAEVDKELIFLINANDGEFLPQKKNVEYDKVRFKKKYKLLLPDNKYLLKQKLIRRLGHFKIRGKEHFCYRFFYDGSFCIEEVKNLLFEYIENSSDSDKFELIVYSAKYSPWLKESIDLLPEIKTIAFESIDQCVGNYQSGKLLFITDLVCSGDSIKEMITTLLNKLPNLENDKIDILSILNSAKPEENNENKRKMTINNYDFQIKYFVDVNVDIKTIEDNCEMCKLGLSFDNIGSDNIQKLNSYNFWYLSDESKYEEEKYGRQADKLMKRVPIMRDWFNDNSAYIVYKYINLLETIKINAKFGSIFIYPKEKVTEDEPTPSNKLAESFKIFFNAKEIGIPREIIDKYKNAYESIKDIDDIQEDWIKTLKEQSPDKNYIIIDEFHKEGGTFESMLKILKQLNRYPKCFFPVINFNPQKNEEYKRNYEDLQILSLYEFYVS
jgi:hypothetical protein